MTWKVWFQPHGKFGKRYKSGTLTVSPGNATFEGKSETLSIDRARSVGRHSIGMTNWVDVEYEADGEIRHAYFVDRRMLGWSGMLGGNEKLANELREALVPGS